MKKTEQVSLEVGLTGGHVMLNVSKKDYETIKNQIQKKNKDWLTVDLENGAEFELNIPAVQYLRMRPSGVRGRVPKVVEIKRGVLQNGLITTLNH